MEPNTASSLKTSKYNALKDFIHVAGPLSVTHLIMFSQTVIGSYIRFSRLPTGPTVTFKITEYSLNKDVRSIQDRPRATGPEAKTAPILILSGFKETYTEEEKHLELTKTTIQQLFPSIRVSEVSLDTIKRAVLFHYDEEKEEFEFRHYYISNAVTGLSKNIKNIYQKRTGDLSEYKDVSDFVLEGTDLTMSDAEDNEDTLIPREIAKKKSKTALRLQEIGPRMTMKLNKIQEGVCDGPVRYHRIVKKTDEELEKMEARLEKKRLVKSQRRTQQEKNVLKKKLERGEILENEVEDNNLEYYKEAVGVEPTEEEIPFLKGVNTSYNKQKGYGKKRKADQQAKTEDPYLEAARRRNAKRRKK
eukprot:TRINITY_DN5336_c0_g1_i1.p1 TRINITY_DN5336_c0_g1~~TRINITY_DN5336_c0_g1_i1.p1  ORF type:complete len:411 (-),score=102.50 TRINITY_DN5336_c0_g1_i1:100-1179(-)